MSESPDKQTVVVIDDEKNIVDLLVDILESADFRAIGCTVWTEAVNAINRENPDLVLLDLKMPTIDGPSMLEFIRGEGLNVPVIVVSGFVTDQVTDDLSKLGVSAFVGKPFRASQILAEVRRVLGETKASAPASMSALYETSEEGSSSSSTGVSGPNPNEVLAALQKLDGPETAASPPPPAAPKEPAQDVLSALQKNSHPAPETKEPVPPAPVSAPPPAKPVSPRDPAPVPQSPEPDPFQPTPPSDSDSDPGRSVSVTGKRHHHHRPPRRKKLTKRNFLLFGSMFVICLAVAGFMAAMNWYASQIDVEEIRKNTEKAITKQATNEILQQLKDSRK